MGRTFTLLIGLAAGILLAGIGAGLLIPLLPGPWHSASVVWGASAALVALGLGLAFLASRPSRR